MSNRSMRTGSGKPYQYTRLGAQVQNVKSNSVYVFGEGDVCACEDEVVEFEMDKIRPRKGRPKNTTKEKEGPAFVERQITEDETLQSLALQYGLPVSELKRVNNLIRDQDFFALTRIKIPVKQYSFLVDQIHMDDEKIVEQQRQKQSSEAKLSNGAAYLDSDNEGRLSYESDQDLSTDLSDPETQKNVIRNISINCATKTQTREARRFLHNMDKDLSKIMSNNSRTERRSLDEVISVLTNKSVQPLGKTEKQDQLTASRLNWKAVIVVIIVLCVFPVVYGLLYYTKTLDKLGKGNK